MRALRMRQHCWQLQVSCGCARMFCLGLSCWLLFAMKQNVARQISSARQHALIAPIHSPPCTRVQTSCCRCYFSAAAPAPWPTCAPPSTTTAAAGGTPSRASSTTPASMTSGPSGGWGSTASPTTAHPPSAASALRASGRHPLVAVSLPATSVTAWVRMAAGPTQSMDAGEVSEGRCFDFCWSPTTRLCSSSGIKVQYKQGSWWNNCRHASVRPRFRELEIVHLL